MRIPEALLVHQSPGRIRLRVPSMRGNGAFFSRAQAKLSALDRVERLEINPASGSLLFLGKGLDPKRIAETASKRGLFDLQVTELRPVPLAKRIATPLGGLSSKVRSMTGGQLDLPGAAFLLLLGFGLVQILRGDLRSPPWYTAFWYAFGIFSKSVADMISKEDEGS